MLDSRRRGFNPAYVLGDPFALATIGIAVIGWLIAFIASILAISLDHGFPKFAWWTVAYMFCTIVGVVLVLMTGEKETYSVALVGFLSAGIVLTTSAINSVIYSPEAPFEAAAGGHILLAIVCIVWTFYFGTTPRAAPREFIDQFALHKDRSSYNQPQPMSNNYPQPPQPSAVPPPQMYTSAQLNGFETSSPVSGFGGGPVGGINRVSTQPQNTMSSTPAPTTSQDVSQPTEYPYKAKAIYSYEANPDDANEISFTKHEILEVSDVSGRWWQARKENGETGIAPSNYLILL